MPSLLFRNARIFDGARVVVERDLLVTEGKIAEIGTGLEARTGAEVIECEGMTLFPGLIDCHTHAWGEALQQALAFGVTTEMDMFTDPSWAAEMRKEQSTGATHRADLFSAGFCATVPGGHGTQYGIKVPTITDPALAQEWVDARMAEGSDYIKIICEDGSASGNSWPTVTGEVVAAIAAAARARGKISIVHPGSYGCAESAFKGGATALAHLFLDREPEPAWVELAKDGRFVVPTLTVLESACGTPSGSSLIDHDGFAPYLTENDQSNLRRSFPAGRGLARYDVAVATVRELRDAGVPICAGSDAPNPGTVHGASLHRELELLVAAGLSPAEALAAATSVAAKSFGLKDRGRVAVGSRADLVLVEGDPTNNILDTRRIADVWKLGVRADREAFRSEVSESRAASALQRQAAPPPGSEDGLVSDFEDGITSRFGSGWTISTESYVGGRSVAEMSVVDDGADSSAKSLRVSGRIIAEYMFPWAGAQFSPGDAPLAPVNLSSKKRLSFWAKGDGATQRVMLFARSRGFYPSTRKFAPAEKWERFEFEIADFDGLDGHDLTGLLFSGPAEPGDFWFQIDEVRFD